MAFYSVSGKQVTLNSILVSLLTTGLLVFGFLIRDYFELPEVIKNEKNECVKVINHKNGDAFNCNDVNVTLRHYRPHTE